MTLYRVLFEGTVIGEALIEAETQKRAREIADDCPIDIIVYPTNWEITDILDNKDQP